MKASQRERIRMHGRAIISATILTAAAFAAIACSDPTSGPAAVASVEVAPTGANLRVGNTRQFSATLRDNSANVLEGRTISWASSNGNVLSVSGSGLATALDTGTVTLTASSGGASGNVSVVVSLVPAVSIAVSPGADTLVAGTSAPLSVTLRDSANQVLNGRPVTWESSAPTIATVSTGGNVSALGVGATWIRAIAGTLRDSARIVVQPVFASSISAGGGNACAVTAQSQVYCWQSGTAPTAFGGGVALTSLSWGATDGYGCGVSSAGKGYCWGDDTQQLRRGVLPRATTPGPSEILLWNGAPNVLEVSAGNLHACALLANSETYCWGNGLVGQLGDGLKTSTDSIVFWRKAGGRAFVDIASGATHSCGVVASGAAFCWGSGSNGRLGRGGTDLTDADTPVAVAGGIAFAALAIGDSHNCGLSTAGLAYCWGRNTNGQLGSGATNSYNTAPVSVSGGRTYSAISAEEGTTCALTTTGQAYCWGVNATGQLGDGTTTSRNEPLAAAGERRFARIAVAGNFACGMDAAGDVYCWGGSFGTGQRITPP